MIDVESAKVTFFQKKLVGLRLRTWTLLFLLAPLFLWGLMNLVFSTRVGTGFLERKIESKLGCACGIESVTWSPWAGVRVSDLDIYASENETDRSRILHVAEIKVDPSWLSLWEGKKRFERLEVDGMVGTLSIEQIQAMVTRYHRKRPVTVHSKSEQDLVAPKPDRVPAPEPFPIPPAPVPVTQPPSQRPVSPSQESIVVGAKPVDDFAGMVILKNTDLRLYSQKNPVHEVELCGLSAEIPIWGEAREGELRFGRVEIEHYSDSLARVIPLTWDGSALRVEKQAWKVFGLDVEFEGSLRIAQGLPMGINLNVIEQQMDFSPLYPDRPTPIEFESLSSRNILRVNLLDPTTLSGRSVSTFKGLVLHDPKDGGGISFDRGTAIFKLNSSGIVANDVRAIGEVDSILMNGFVTRGGEAAATVRIVSSPERARSHEKRIKGAGLPLELKFQPLLTPDREYHDFRLEARSGTLMIDLGLDEKWVPLFPTAQAILGRSIQPKPPLP